MFVIPKKDLTIFDPALMNSLPPEGRDVGNDFATYWERHRADGSIQVVADDKIEAAKANADKVQAQRAKDEADAKAKADAEAEKKPSVIAPVPGQK